MNSAIERLITLNVADAMTKDVVCVSASQTMAEAAAALKRREVSGAPVLNDCGRLVGILSATDFIRHEMASARPSSAQGEAEHCLASHGELGALSIEYSGQDLVGAHMTSAVQTVRPHVRLLDAARIMCAQHVHRLPVVEENGKVIGMITSLDLVAAMVKAVEE
jgi:CBS domain-containing protein